MQGDKVIGLFGGSFDPIHWGHINLALQIKELGKLDHVLLCPAATSPFKVDQPPKASGSDRLEMCRLVLEDVPGLEVTDMELQRGGVSYAIDTVRELGNVRLILAEDAWPRLHQWKEAEKLIQLAKPLTGSRHGNHPFDEPHLSLDSMKILKSGRHSTAVMEISSTEIRRRLYEGGHYLGHWVPGKVIDYIKHNKLYSETNHEETTSRPSKHCRSGHL